MWIYSFIKRDKSRFSRIRPNKNRYVSGNRSENLGMPFLFFLIIFFLTKIPFKMHKIMYFPVNLKKNPKFHQLIKVRSGYP